MVLLVAMLSSCNQGSSLEHYYVDNQEKPNFFSIDVPTSLLNIDASELSSDQADAYNSIKKLNMLAYKLTAENQSTYDSELAKVKSILNNSKYEELIRGGNPEAGSFIIKFVGDEDDIDEFVLFGNADDKGFAIVRVLGNNMNPNKIMALASVMEKANINDEQLSQFTEFFK